MQIHLRVSLCRAQFIKGSSATPTFQGSMVRVDIKTGSIKWRTKMIPDNGGKGHLYSGAALWGSSPPVDAKRNLVFIATGNLYSVPPDVQACQLREANKTVPDIPDPCIRAGDHSESILALDLDTGKIVWAHHLGGVDVWNVACISGRSQPNCPPASGPDYDFGEAPMLLTVRNNKSREFISGDDEEWQDRKVGSCGLSIAMMGISYGMRLLDLVVLLGERRGDQPRMVSVSTQASSTTVI